MTRFKIAGLGLSILLSVSIGVAVFQMYRQKNLAVPRRLLIEESNLVMRVPLSRDDCCQISQGVGTSRERIEVEGKPVDQSDLQGMVLEFLDRNAHVKAIVLSVGISTNSHERVETILRNVSKECRIEFFQFFENSKYSLEFLP